MAKRKKAKKSGSAKKRTSHKRKSHAAPKTTKARKSHRTPAQKAATAKMLAANKSKSGGTRRKSKSSGGKRRSGRKKSKSGWTGKFHKYSQVHAHRRRTHNPGSALVQAGLAAGAGILAYLVTLAATYYVTKDSAQQSRNRKIVGGAIIGIAALVVAKKRPLIAAGLAAGGALAVFGDYATLKMMQYLPQKAPTNTAAVFAQNMRGLNQIGAVYAQNMQGLNQIGDVGVPAAPWTQPGPFG